MQFNLCQFTPCCASALHLPSTGTNHSRLHTISFILSFSRHTVRTYHIQDIVVTNCGSKLELFRLLASTQKQHSGHCSFSPFIVHTHAFTSFPSTRADMPIKVAGDLKEKLQMQRVANLQNSNSSKLLHYCYNYYTATTVEFIFNKTEHLWAASHNVRYVKVTTQNCARHLSLAIIKYFCPVN